MLLTAPRHPGRRENLCGSPEQRALVREWDRHEKRLRRPAGSVSGAQAPSPQPFDVSNTIRSSLKGHKDSGSQANELYTTGRYRHQRRDLRSSPWRGAWSRCRSRPVASYAVGLPAGSRTPRRNTHPTGGFLAGGCVGTGGGSGGCGRRVSARLTRMMRMVACLPGRVFAFGV